MGVAALPTALVASAATPAATPAAAARWTYSTSHGFRATIRQCVRNDLRIWGGSG
jgi:hypothetical protein